MYHNLYDDELALALLDNFQECITCHVLQMSKKNLHISTHSRNLIMIRNRSIGSSDICYKKDDIKVKDDQEHKETIQETCTSMAS